jgi:hypothetical protein
LIGMDGHVGLSFSEDDAINCVPDRLFTFLNLVYGGQDIWNQDGNHEDSKSTKQTKILSVCQDIVYSVSEDRKWIPKHIGLSCTLHQMTSSKQLVNLFHSAGHTVFLLMNAPGALTFSKRGVLIREKISKLTS